MGKMRRSARAWTVAPYVAERLESRRLLAGDVMNAHSDPAGTGQQPGETVLQPSNINPADFGKRFATPLDGQVYAQPLAASNVTIMAGPLPGVHDVVFAATMNDGLYAIDAFGGAVLWHDSFLNLADPRGAATPTAGVTPVPQAAMISGDIGPVLGIVATPVIDPAAGRIYVVTNTREVRPSASGAGGTDTHYVQRLWAVNLADGSAAVAPEVIGDTIFNSASFTSYSGYQYIAGPIVKGSGNNNPAVAGTGAGTADADGWIANGSGFNPAASGEIAFNALLQMTRTGLSLINGNIFMGFASHGDNGPYYGWVLGYNASSLANTAAFVTTPTYEPVHGNSPFTAQGGVWMSGGAITTDGTYLYLTTGNGQFNGAASNFSAGYATMDAGHAVRLPMDGNYGDSVLKLAVDPAAGQGGAAKAGIYDPDVFDPNGFGLKVIDFFTPSNAAQLNAFDADLGSGDATLLPSSVLAANGDPVLVTAGKEGRIYLLDREDLGGFNPSYPGGSTDPSKYDRVLGEYLSGGTTFAAASFFGGDFYLTIDGKPLRAFAVSSFAPGMVPPGTASAAPIAGATAMSFNARGGTTTISSNGSQNGIVWVIDAAQDASADLLAYAAQSFQASPANVSIAPIYDSNSNAARDALGGAQAGATATKFSVPSVYNGTVYIGTGGSNTSAVGSLVAYGLLGSFLQSNPSHFAAPTNLAAHYVQDQGVALSWTGGSTLASATQIDRSADGMHWTSLAFVPNGTSTFLDATAAPGQTWYYRASAVSAYSASPYSNTAEAVDVAPTLLSVVSRKAQGPAGVPYDIAMPLGGTHVGIEDRIGGPTQLVLTFDRAIAAGPNFAVRLSDGSLGSVVFGSATITINLSGAINGVTLAVSLMGVTDPATGASGNDAFNVGVLAGDANGDGRVDVVDLGILASHFGQAGTATPAQGDFTGDGSVDVVDLGILATDFGRSLAGPPPGIADMLVRRARWPVHGHRAPFGPTR